LFRLLFFPPFDSNQRRINPYYMQRHLTAVSRTN
jgi:hypothetical protein